ncbi:MAG: transporter ATP-binding protein [Rickettsiales bacterium]|jgi:lipopolysaccharide transport system ATP-binding protein|nr:transporter ATP-binding protein [Rickettsiales bacterium]
MCSDRAIAIEVDNLSKTYQIFAKPSHRLAQGIFRGAKSFCTPFEALKPLSFTIHKGEAVGIIGQNGSGKSTLLQMICGTLTPSGGICKTYGRISALLELGAGFNPEFTGKENVYLNAAILGLSRAETDAKYDSILEFASIGDKIYQPVKTYSSGMYVRLAFAVAIATQPDILIVDEALAVGDELFQRKCFARIKEIQAKGAAILFVSHSSRTIQDLCSRALLLDRGELLYDGAPKKAVAYYHKLIFAPDAERDTVRRSIQSQKTEASSAEPVLSRYNPDLSPESLVSYACNGAKISEPALACAKTRERVNLLKRGEWYYLTYDIEFSVYAEQIRFGMMIKTPSGVQLGGASCHTNEVSEVQSGTRFKVCIKFKAALLQGSYFINCGCSGVVNGERIFLHRIEDALTFKVLPEAENDSHSAGLVDFSPEPIWEKAL